jgi:probable FeS assembly SUF system protein SufT
MFNHDKALTVSRDCQGKLIPSGDTITIKSGSIVMLTQALGNAYTVYLNGNLLRIAGKNGDALGLVVSAEQDINEFVGDLQAKIMQQLSSCYDPEIPVNIVDLGLIYKSELVPLAENSYQLNIQMTLTAPACGMGPVLVADIEQKLLLIKEIERVAVELVFDPPWDRDKMSAAAQLHLGLL